MTKFNIGDVVEHNGIMMVATLLITSKINEDYYIVTRLESKNKARGRWALGAQMVDQMSKILMSSPKVYSGPLSQEEIDEIIESYSNMNSQYSSQLSWDEELESLPPVISDQWTKEILPPACKHKWKKYTGLVQSFEYCEICDKKKGEV